jgi:hypothetical protein
MERGNGTGKPAANTAGRKKEDTPGSRKGGREDGSVTDGGDRRAAEPTGFQQIGRQAGGVCSRARGGGLFMLRFHGRLGDSQRYAPMPSLPFTPSWHADPESESHEPTEMTVLDAIEVLVLAPAATEQEIRATHRTLAMVWHPDRFASDSEACKFANVTMKWINLALEVQEKARFQTEKSADNARQRASSVDGGARPGAGASGSRR